MRRGELFTFSEVATVLGRLKRNAKQRKSKSKSARRPRERVDRRLLLEPLEDRRLMAVLSLGELRDGGTADSQGFVLTNQVPSHLAGFSVSNAGDINADGFDDLLVGAPVASGSLTGQGNTFVVYGKSFGLNDLLLSPGIQPADGEWLFGLEVPDHMGFSVSNAGDVNGDGFHDFVIGAPFADRQGTSGTAYGAGQAYLLFGGSDPPANINELDGSNGVLLQGLLPYDRAGWSVGAAGDVNGDGFDDFLIGAPVDDSYSVTAAAGQAYLVYGKGTAFAPTLNLWELNGTSGLQLSGLAVEDHLGSAVSTVGDLNGDGFDDFAVSSPYADPNAAANSILGSGSAYVIFGGTNPAQGVSNLNGTNGFRVDGMLPYERAGFSLSSAGDFNGDGFEDLLIGAPGDRDNPWDYGDYAQPSGSGRAFVVFGKASGFSAVTKLSLLDGSGNGFSINGIDGIAVDGGDGVDYAGFSVSSAGDVDGDGFADLLVGAPFVDTAGGVSGVGESYLIFGRPEGFADGLSLATLTDDQGIRLVGDRFLERSGYSVSAAGDVNGDGFDDVLIGAPSSYPLSGTGGRSYVLFGQDFRGKSPIVGTEADSDLTGTPGANAIIGAQGNDIIAGAGGEDVLRGGQGNDILGVGDLTFRHVDGGRGTDTLRLDGAGFALDLAAVANTRITGIEEIDISGSGANSLTIGSVQEILNLSDTSNRVVIHRGVDDTVNRGAGWSEQSPTTIAGRPYRVYTQGAATLVVENPPPALDLNGSDDAGTGFTMSFAEDQPAVAIVDADLTASDEASIESATITITNLMNGANEILSVSLGTSGLTANANPTLGILTLAGAAQASVYQDVLRTLTYRNASDAPELTDRLITVVVEDGTSNSNVATTTVSLSAINDAPVLSSTPAPVFTAVPEDDFNSLGNTVATVVSNGSINDPDGNTVEAIAVVGSSSGNGTWQYSIADDWLDLGTVTSTMARLLGPTAKLRFVPNANFAGSATLSFRAWDQTTGSSGSVHDVSTNGGTTAFSFNVVNATLTVQAINDAPILDPSFDHTLTAIDEDETNSSGNMITTIVDSNAITDIDGPAVGGIAIVAVDSTNGQWQHSVDGTSWSATTATEASALLLAPLWRLRFVPDPDFSGTAVFSFKAWDQSAGLSGGRLNATTTGGTTPFSIVQENAFITVNQIDDPPTLDPIAGVTLDTTVTTHDVALTGISDGDEDTEALSITAFSNNPDLIPNPTVTYTSPDTTGTLTIEPTGSETGSALITVTVEEGDGATQTRTFLVSIGADGAVWQNTSAPLDVDNSGFVVPLDVLLIINELNNPRFRDERGRLPLPRPTNPTPPFYDVNGDAHITPLDALIVINFLNNRAASEGEGGVINSPLDQSVQPSLYSFESVTNSSKSASSTEDTELQITKPTSAIQTPAYTSSASLAGSSRDDYFASYEEASKDLLLDLVLEVDTQI